MASTGRDFQINGPTIVRVKFGAHVSGGLLQSGTIQELGLASEQINVTPRWYYRPVNTEDYGPNVPVDLEWMLAEMDVRLTLVHYDKAVLEMCMIESMAGGNYVGSQIIGDRNAGILAPAGMLMGGFVPLFASGCHYFSVNLISSTTPWRFPSSFLAEQPLILPLGTQYSMASVNFRAIPFRVPPGIASGIDAIRSGVVPGQGPGDLIILSGTSYETQSSGALLFDHNKDLN